jgi:hypothetical protein
LAAARLRAEREVFPDRTEASALPDFAERADRPALADLVGADLAEADFAGAAAREEERLPAARCGCARPEADLGRWIVRGTFSATAALAPTTSPNTINMLAQIVLNLIQPASSQKGFSCDAPPRLRIYLSALQ